MGDYVIKPRNVVVEQDGQLVQFLYVPQFQNRWNSRFQRAQGVVDLECLIRSSPFIPFDRGVLESSGLLNTVIGSGIVRWVTPYAARLYYNPDFNFQDAPIRGAFWFENMKSANLSDIRRLAGREFR